MNGSHLRALTRNRRSGLREIRLACSLGNSRSSGLPLSSGCCRNHAARIWKGENTMDKDNSISADLERPETTRSKLSLNKEELYLFKVRGGLGLKAGAFSVPPTIGPSQASCVYK